MFAEAERAYLLAEEEARELLAEGYRPETAGAELEPAKTILFATAERIAALTTPALHGEIDVL